MIRLSNNNEVLFFAASGAMGFKGKGWPWELWLPRFCFNPSLFCIVLKTLTKQPRQGHGWLKVRPIFYEGFELVGWLNALGLPNPGFYNWYHKSAPKIDFKNQKIVVSIAGVNPNPSCELYEMAACLDHIPELAAIELNVSCPNVKDNSGHALEGLLDKNTREVIAICEGIGRYTRHPIILKLTFTQDYVAIAKGTESLVSAISINAVPYHVLAPVVFPPGRISPLAQYGGGAFSGKVAQSITWKMVQELAAVTTTPIIGPGVWEYEDIDKLFQLGARAVGFGSIFIAHPWRPTRMVKKLLKDKRALSF